MYGALASRGNYMCSYAAKKPAPKLASRPPKLAQAAGSDLEWQEF